MGKYKKTYLIRFLINNNLNKLYTMIPMMGGKQSKDKKELIISNYLFPNQNLFIRQLDKLNIDYKEYLKIAKQTAKKAGYNPLLLNFSDKKNKKLNYNGVDFGAVNYNDFIIYKFLEKRGEIPDGMSLKKQNQYRKRAYQVMVESDNKYSPASLSYYILW